MSNMFTQRYHPSRDTSADRSPEESARRPSADFVARFKEQHFSPEGQLAAPKDRFKEEPNDNECQTM